MISKAALKICCRKIHHVIEVETDDSGLIYHDLLVYVWIRYLMPPGMLELADARERGMGPAASTGLRLQY